MSLRTKCVLAGLAALTLSIVMLGATPKSNYGHQVEVNIRLLDERDGRALSGLGIIIASTYRDASDPDRLARRWRRYLASPEDWSHDGLGWGATTTNALGDATVSLKISSGRTELRDRQGCEFIAVVDPVRDGALVATIETAGRWRFDSGQGLYRLQLGSVKIRTDR